MKRNLILSMIIFGTIGLFRRYTPIPSSMLAMFRGYIGMMFLVCFVFLRGGRLNWKDIRKNILLLVISGAFIGVNWILLFEAYQYTSVATATLCYYMAPVLVIVASPVFLKEKLTGKKMCCVLVSLIGMVLISGILNSNTAGQTAQSGQNLKGIVLGLGAAAFYASVILLNQKIQGISAYDKTIVQLAVAAVTVTPYVFLTENLSEITFTPMIVMMILVIGIIHTGISYAMYFGSMSHLKAQTIALFSYLDPVVAVMLSAIVLREKMGIVELAGAVLVLGATLVSELNPENVSSKIKHKEETNFN